MAVVIESPCFFDNNKELAEYLENTTVEGMFVAYHGAGATFLPDVPKYATQNAAPFSKNGGGKALIDKFTAAFGEIFDSSVHEITNVIEAGEVTIGGIDFSATKATIRQKNCLHCGNCMNICPQKAVVREA